MTLRRTSRSSPPQGCETRPQSTVYQPRRGGRKDWRPSHPSQTSNVGVVTLCIKGARRIRLAGRTLVLHTVKDNDGQGHHCVMTLVRLMVFSSEGLFCCFCLIKNMEKQQDTGVRSGSIVQLPAPCHWGSSNAATFKITSKSRVVDQRRERKVALKW